MVKNHLLIKAGKAQVVGKVRLMEVGAMAVRVLAVTVVLITATDLITAVVQVTEAARVMVMARDRAMAPAMVAAQVMGMVRDRVMAQEITAARVLIHWSVWQMARDQVGTPALDTVMITEMVMGAEIKTRVKTRIRIRFRVVIRDRIEFNRARVEIEARKVAHHASCWGAWVAVA